MTENAHPIRNITFEINPETYDSVIDSVRTYIDSFRSDDAFIIQNLTLKKEHIQRVVTFSEMLARSLNCSETAVMIAQISAWLHDIGRFEQFLTWHTFNDSRSVDHAVLALDIIHKKQWLQNLNPEAVPWILAAVENHNKRSIAKNTPPEILFFSQLLRDADKLDIMDMAVAEYGSKNKKKNSAFTLGLENSLQVSAPIIEAIRSGQLPDKKDLLTVTDFKLLQMSWVFDLHFRKSYERVNQKQFLKQIFETLPKSDLIFEAYRIARIHIENQLIHNR
ncbi:MAG TPA: HD domain-containing protein [Prolixibacteraceae bacterium]|nr:HD domain-containing protein [Prolixibacteraceae bacterium]